MGLPKNSDRPLKPFGDTSDPRGFWMLLHEHLQWLRVHNFARATIHKRGLYVRAFALWCLERDLTQPRQISKAMLESYQRYLYRYRKAGGEPLAWSGQHLHLKEVRAFFAALVKMNHLAFSPAAQLELPRQPKTLPKAILSADEVERILAQPDTTTPLGLRDRAIFETLYSTGIRRSELCSLRIDDVQVDRRCLFVNQGKARKDRYVPIGLRALLWIARYVEGTRSRLLLDEKERALFVTKEGEPISPDTLTEYGRRYIAAAGIDKPGSCHIYRHTMATLMHDAGADLTLIQVILGHEKTETTQIYARTSLKRLLDVHDRTHPAERKDDEEEGKTSSPG
jgi:integrase/recombinase XerD